MDHLTRKESLQAASTAPPAGSGVGPALIDAQVLDSLLSLPDPDLQASLCTQIIADLRRLEQALATALPGDLGRFAHELKGLTATIGANPLAELSVRLQLADELGQDCDVLVATLRRQIDAVCTIIEGRAGQRGSA